MGYENAFEYRESAATAAATLDILTARDRLAGPDLLRAAAEAFDRVGDPDGLRRVYALAHDAVQDDALLPREAQIDRAQFRIRFGSYLNRQGEPDRALQELQTSLSVFATLGDDRSRAVTLGDIARIRANKGEATKLSSSTSSRCKSSTPSATAAPAPSPSATSPAIRANKGEVDEALKLHYEEMQTYDALGDRRSRATTLGDIARIRANKGEVDEALKLHLEQVQIFDALGDRRSRAVTLGDIARIRAKIRRSMKLSSSMRRDCRPTKSSTPLVRAVTLGDIARIRANKGEVDEALKLHLEQVQIFDALGDRRSRAVTLGDIARIRANKGEVDEALKLHLEQVQIFEALGDRRFRAVTLGDIARIRANKGEVDEALKLHLEQVQIFEALGDQDGIANVSFNIGQIRLRHAIQHSDAAAFEEAVVALAKSYAILLNIGRLDGICVVGAAFGQALAAAGQRDEARTVLQRSLDGFRKLGLPDHAAQVEEVLRQLFDTAGTPPRSQPPASRGGVLGWLAKMCGR